MVAPDWQARDDVRTAFLPCIGLDLCWHSWTLWILRLSLVVSVLPTELHPEPDWIRISGTELSAGFIGFLWPAQDIPSGCTCKAGFSGTIATSTVSGHPEIFDDPLQWEQDGTSIGMSFSLEICGAARGQRPPDIPARTHSLGLGPAGHRLSEVPVPGRQDCRRQKLRLLLQVVQYRKLLGLRHCLEGRRGSPREEMAEPDCQLFEEAFEHGHAVLPFGPERWRKRCKTDSEHHSAAKKE